MVKGRRAKSSFVPVTIVVVLTLTTLTLLLPSQVTAQIEPLGGEVASISGVLLPQH